MGIFNLSESDKNSIVTNKKKHVIELLGSRGLSNLFRTINIATKSNPVSNGLGKRRGSYSSVCLYVSKRGEERTS